MHPAFLYLPGGRLTMPELSACRLDGHLVEIGEGYIPADLVEVSHTRALSLRSVIDPETAASGPTAAWIHGAGDTPPTPHHVRRAVPHRIRPELHARVVFHDTCLRESEIVRIAGVMVMTPLRTMIDLALTVHRQPDVRAWIELLAHEDARLVDAAAEALAAMSRVPGCRTARAVLRELSQAEVTRYTS